MADPTRVRRLFAESAVIVFSILLAFGVDAWWDGRQTEAEERAVLAAVWSEADRNRAALDEILSINAVQRDRLDRFFRADPAC